MESPTEFAVLTSVVDDLVDAVHRDTDLTEYDQDDLVDYLKMVERFIVSNWAQYLHFVYVDRMAR